jgi:hypothetical protein
MMFAQFGPVPAACGWAFLFDRVTPATSIQNGVSLLNCRKHTDQTVDFFFIDVGRECLKLFVADFVAAVEFTELICLVHPPPTQHVWLDRQSLLFFVVMKVLLCLGHTLIGRHAV